MPLPSLGIEGLAIIRSGTDQGFDDVPRMTVPWLGFGPGSLSQRWDGVYLYDEASFGFSSSF
jgi:hypothetical protein